MVEPEERGDRAHPILNVTVQQDPAPVRDVVG